MPQPSRRSTFSAFSVLRSRSFTLLWAGEFISDTGSALTVLVTSILVFQLTGSALSVGLMLIANTAPKLLLGFVSGVFVDRYDRKRLMVATELASGALVFSLPLLLPFGLVWLYLGVALISVLGQLYDPAHESVLPELANDEDLAAANSLFAITDAVAIAVGFVAAGVIATRLPIVWAFYFDAATYLVAAALIAGIRIESIAVDERTGVRTVLRNLRAGARYLWGSDVLRFLMVLNIGLSLATGLWNVLLLPFVERVLHASEFVYGLQEAVGATGVVVGSFVVIALASRLRDGQWIVLSLLGVGVVGVGYAWVRSVPLALPLIAIWGLLQAPSSIARRLLVQRHTQREMRGRVSGVFFAVRDLFFLVGMAAAGLADLVDVRWMLVGSSLITLTLGLVAALLPGVGQPAAEWRRAFAPLRAADGASRPERARPATPADLERVALRLPALARLGAAERADLFTGARVSLAPAGTPVVRRGHASDAAYFIIQGRAVAGWDEGDDYRLLEVLHPGDFFGEIAAMTGAARTADVVSERDTTLLELPAAALRRMAEHPSLSRLFTTTINERLLRMDLIDLPRFGGVDRQTLKDLRTDRPAPGGAR